MVISVFTEDFARELREILLSTSVAEIYDPPGELVDVREEPFLGEWQLRSLGFDPDLGPSRIICQLSAGDKEVTATVDASDFPSHRKQQRSRSRAWNNSQYHDLAVLLSVLIEEQILTRSPSKLRADHVRIRLPKDRDTR